MIMITWTEPFPESERMENEIAQHEFSDTILDWTVWHNACWDNLWVERHQYYL
jgi:hypothetical protein